MRKFFIVYFVSLVALSVAVAYSQPYHERGPLHPPQDRMELLQSFEDLLHDQAKLLYSFEDLVKGSLYRLTPGDRLKLLFSFEELLKSQERLLKSFEELIRRHGPTWELMLSFEGLIESQCGLKLSFEELIKRVGAVLELLKSFEDLLKSDIELLFSFEGLLKQIQDRLPPDQLARLLFSFENLLHCQEKLLYSFEELLKMDPTPDPDPPASNHSSHMPLLPPLPSFLESLQVAQREEQATLEVETPALVAEAAKVEINEWGFGVAHIIVQNKGPFTVRNAVLIATLKGSYEYDILRQELGKLEPEARVSFEVHFIAPKEAFSVKTLIIGGVY